jgi:hypothetical protein
VANTMKKPARRSLGGRRDSTSLADRYERERKYLGFAPLPLIDSIINAVNDYQCDAIDALEDQLHIALPNANADDITEVSVSVSVSVSVAQCQHLQRISHAAGIDTSPLLGAAVARRTSTDM